jgi:hypothetical protein
MREGYPEVFVDAVLQHFAAVKAGRMRTTETVQALLGRPAMGVEQWVRLYKDSFVNRHASHDQWRSS